MPTTWTLSEILRAFETGSGYQREAVEAALELGQACRARLVELLSWVVEEPDLWGLERPYRIDHFYAAALLGYLGAREAHPVLIDLLSLPARLPFQLFGDMVTELFPALLFRTCGGSLSLMDALLQNRDADPYCRIEAADAMTWALAAGQVERAEVIERLGRAFSLAIDDMTEDVEMCSLLAGALCHLCPAELMPKIREGYALELIDVTHVTLEEIEGVLKQGEEAALQDLRRTMARRMPESIHDWLGHWSCLGDVVREEERHRQQREEARGQAKAEARVRRGQEKNKRARRRKKRRAARGSRKRK